MTDEHPFYRTAGVAGSTLPEVVMGLSGPRPTGGRRSAGWAPARLLRPGDRVLGDAGELQVLANSEEAHPQGVAVYNLEVEADHTYFVLAEHAADDADAAWVHNAPEEFYNRKAAKALLAAVRRDEGFTPLNGSGGVGKVYLMQGSRLKAKKDYVGSTRRQVGTGGRNDRMRDADHITKTIDGKAPDARLVGAGLTSNEKWGLEGILVDIGGSTLSNAQKAIDVTLAKNASRVAAGNALITKWFLAQ